MHDAPMPSVRLWARSNREILLVLAGAAVLRISVYLAAVRAPQRFWSMDDREYLLITTHLHAAYLDSAGRIFDLGLRRPPGYPLFLRGIFDVFGHHYAAVVGVQIVLSVATVAVAFWLAGLVLPQRLALVAAAALALDPASIFFANQMLTETLFTLIVTVAVALIVCCYRSNSTVTAVAAGLTLGLAVLVRPIAEYLPLFIAVTLVVIGVREKTLRLLVPVTLAFVIGFAVPSGAWVFRNYEVTGVPLVSTIDGHNLLQYRAVGAMVEDGVPRSLAQHDVLVRLAPHVSPGDNAARVSRAEARVGLSILAEHPVGTLKTWLRGEAKLLFGPARSETATLLTGAATDDALWLRILVMLDAVITAVIVVAAAVAAGGLLVGYLRNSALWLLLTPAAYLVIISGGHEAYSRFRVPVAPLLAVLGAAALTVRQRHHAALPSHPGPTSSQFAASDRPKSPL